MAVSGRKRSDFPASLSRGSAKDFQHCCAPCLIEGQHVEAHGYCIDCCEYLCKNCHKFHKKTKATRNHQLADVCTEKCAIHKIEVIKFFCQKHEELGCHDCMTMDHRSCYLDYIPKVCTGIGDSEEYRVIMKEIDVKLTEADAVLKQASIKDKEIDDSHDKVIQDILKLRKEINDHLDTIQKKIEAEASMKRTTSQNEVKAVVTSCTNFKSNIKKLQSSLLNSKATGENGQLFIDIKRAESELKSQKIQQGEISLGKTKTHFTFTSNKDLERMLSVGCFGNLTDQYVAVDPPIKTLQALPATPRKMRTLKSLKHKSDIKLGKGFHIISCVVLSSDKLVLADLDKTLLVVNPEKNVVTEKKQLDSEPWNIAVLPQNQIAVTISNKILIMTTAGKLSTDHIIDVKETCFGTIYHQNCLYVLCQGPCSIQVLDMKGNIKRTISLADQTVFRRPNYIVLSEDHSLLYVSNYGNNSIVSVTLQGEVSAIYKHKDLVGPRGILLLEDGSLLVCCQKNIHHVSADLQQDRTVLEGLSAPQSICYSADRSEVYIGGYNINFGKLAVYCLKYNM